MKIVYQNWVVEDIDDSNICNWKKTILYFYPKDNTPWCSKEAIDFTMLKNKFEK